jgi:hypothetical protein
MNECFAPYKDKHESVIVLGTGETLNQFLNVKDKVKYPTIGVNKIVYSGYNCDYYITGDHGNANVGFNSDPKTYINYPAKIDKFYRTSNKICRGITDKYDVHYYTITERLNKNGRFHKDITKGMGAGFSIIFEALQLACWIATKNIYIIGCDCNRNKSNSKHISDGVNWNDNIVNVIKNLWVKFKNWVEKEYNLNIYVINPVGLNIFVKANMYDIIGVES